MALYTTRVLAAEVDEGAPEEFTVPSDRVLVIRDVSVVAGGAGNFLTLDVDGIYAISLEAGSGTGGLGLHWEGRVACEPGQVVRLQAFSGSVFATVTGYLLSI